MIASPGVCSRFFGERDILEIGHFNTLIINLLQFPSSVQRKPLPGICAEIGLALKETILSRHRELKNVFITGYANDYEVGCFPSTEAYT